MPYTVFSPSFSSSKIAQIAAARKNDLSYHRSNLTTSAFAGVFYYDSMGGNNEQCLVALLKYLEDEHMDKKKAPLDPPASKWHREIVKDIPQQMNGKNGLCHM